MTDFPMSADLRLNTVQRREFFLRSAATIAATAAAINPFNAATAVDRNSLNIPLGLDAHSVRAMKWKATELIKFAAEQQLDAVLLNNLAYFESLEESHLLQLKELADRYQLKIHLGAGSICINAAKFSREWGNAERLLDTAIQAASTVGSPIVNVRIGSIEDRYLAGGIQPRVDEAVRVLKACSSRAKDAGIKFGFENHAGDLRSEELLALIEAVGTDVCGVMLDPGNGLWAMEDPMIHLQALARHAVCNSLRDYMVWESADGATFQWTAIGDGLMDVPTYVQTLAGSNPEMPIFVESISNSARPIPFLTEEHWNGFPNLKAAGIKDFLKLLRQGHAIEIDMPAAGSDAKEFEQQHQLAEFRKSINYLRMHCGVGLQKTN